MQDFFIFRFNLSVIETLLRNSLPIGAAVQLMFSEKSTSVFFQGVKILYENTMSYRITMASHSPTTDNLL